MAGWDMGAGSIEKGALLSFPFQFPLIVNVYIRNKPLQHPQKSVREVPDFSTNKRKV